MKKMLLVTAALIAMTASILQAQEQPVTASSPVVQAALDWLTVVDRGEYGPSWDAASAFLKQVVPQDQFVQALSGVRASLEASVSREFVSSSPQTKLEGGPDGEYDVLVFQSSFAKKAEATETMTLVKEADGIWRVVGYSIR